MRTAVCQKTDRTINNNCLVSEDKTRPAGGGQSDTDQPPVQSRAPGSRIRTSNEATEESGGGGRSVNSPDHLGGVRNKTGATDAQTDAQTGTIQQFENIQGQLEVQTASQFNFNVYLFFSLC